MKRLVALVLAIMLTFSIASFDAVAVSDEETPTVLYFSLTTDVNQQFDNENANTRASGLIISYGLELRKSGTTLTILGVTDCYLEVVKCGFKDLTIQRRKNSDDSWEDYYEFGNVYADATRANLSTTLSVASGYQYRISCKHYAKKNILSVQTVANTSNIVNV